MRRDSSVTPAKILLVEDEAIIAMDVEARLLSLGYEVVGVAATAEEALALAEEFRPGLALMDINIRGPHDGLYAAGELRARFDIPSVMVTAYSDDETIRRSAAVQPLGYLIKPISERDVKAAVEVALLKHASDRELKRYQLELESTVRELREALEKVKVLSGLLPICAWCKSVRNEKGYWEEVSAYLARHADVQLTHGICADCASKL